MLTMLTVEESSRLLAFLKDAGYTEENLRRLLGALELPSRQLRNEARLLDRVAAPTLLNALFRWFWMGHPVTPAMAADLVPGEFLSLLLKCGLVKAHEDRLTDGNG